MFSLVKAILSLVVTVFNLFIAIVSVLIGVAAVLLFGFLAAAVVGAVCFIYAAIISLV